MLLFSVMAGAALAPAAYAGCGFSFYFTILNDTGGVVTHLPPEQGPWSSAYHVQLAPGQSFRARLSFNSCCGGQATLLQNGMLIQEWDSGNPIWTTEEPGFFTWTFEGNCNMAPPPLTRYFNVVVSPTLGIAPVGGQAGLTIGTVLVDPQTGTGHAECTSDRATSLHVQAFGMDGRCTHATTVPIGAGTSRVPIALPGQAQGAIILRFTTREGALRIRKVML